jgi:drug/metabolite transporter (DMT)-like permease
MFFFHGLNLSSSINSGIIMTVNPILVVILSYFILKERITWRKSVGISIGATGAILLTLTAGTGCGDSLLGDLFLFINAASYAVYLVIVKPLMKKYKPFMVIMYVFSFGLLYVILYPPTLMEAFATDFSAIPFDIAMKIVFIIVGVTFFTYLLTTYSLKYINSSITSAYIYLQPVLVMLFAFVFGAMGISDDYTNTITLEKGGYMLIIFTGVYLTSSSSFRKRTQ